VLVLQKRSSKDAGYEIKVESFLLWQWWAQALQAEWKDFVKVIYDANMVSFGVNT